MIVSAAAGVSEIVTNDVDGMVLDDPTDAIKLAAMIRRLLPDTSNERKSEQCANLLNH